MFTGDNSILDTIKTLGFSLELSICNNWVFRDFTRKTLKKPRRPIFKGNIPHVESSSEKPNDFNAPQIKYSTKNTSERQNKKSGKDPGTMKFFGVIVADEVTL